MKKIFVLLFLLCLCALYADPVYDPFFYNRIASEPVKWYPEEGVFHNSIYVSLGSHTGKIYYLINQDFAFHEPKEYSKEILLKGKKGEIVDYTIYAIFEEVDNTVEIFSRTYRINMTDRLKTPPHDDKKYLLNKAEYHDATIDIMYKFKNFEYRVGYNNRIIEFPFNTDMQDTNEGSFSIRGVNNANNYYLVNFTYKKDGKEYTEISGYPLNLVKTKPPTLGSLYWGQVYKQSYMIKIKPDGPVEKMYYWLREWKSDELIVGPPVRSDMYKWLPYTGPITLSSKYGADGTTGLAAYSVGKTGDMSDISGPYYFKVMDVDNTFEQVFDFDKVKKDYSKPILILNDSEYTRKNRRFNAQVTLNFKYFNTDDRFYFTFTSKNSEGRSDLLPCSEKITIKNNETYPVEFDLYHANQTKIGSIIVNGSKMVLPILKGYSGNYVNVSDDAIIEYYLPGNTIRYETTLQLKKYLEISESSPLFPGKIKMEALPGEEKIFKIKFAAFDYKNNNIAESKEYFFKIDKKNPRSEVTAEGIDFSIHHNEKQVLTLTAPEKSTKIFYRFFSADEWKLYKTPLAFYPPEYGMYAINVFVKSIDEAGNEGFNAKPFEIVFDTRGIFIDENLEISGNGTESSPYKSFERVMLLDKLKKVKFIYILSDTIHVSSPINVDTDVVVQSYDASVDFVLETKSVWRNKHIWFDVGQTGFLEFRNVNFSIKSGNVFSKIKGSKLKLYNVAIKYSGIDDFSLLINEQGKLGINNFRLDVTNYPEKFTFFKTYKSDAIIKNADLNITGDSLTVFSIDKSDAFVFENANIDVTSDQRVKFCHMTSSTMQMDKVIYKQAGKFSHASLFSIQDSDLTINRSDFFVNANKAFEVKLLEQKRASSNISSSYFYTKNCISCIGFSVFKGNIDFKQSMLLCEDTADFAYNFRLDFSSLKLYSSIIRNNNCESAINMVLNNSNFEGVNNSVFNTNITSKGFVFWTRDKAVFTTVNSIYYYDGNDENVFIFNNNQDNSFFKPTWFSNAISENMTILENPTSVDYKVLQDDFMQKNAIFDFTGSFNFDNEMFFMPAKDSGLLQGGIPEYSSPVKIPELDFLGRVRIISGIGIDIGAIQLSGN